MLADDVAAKAEQAALKAVEIVVEIMARQGMDVLLWALKKAVNMSASMIMTYMRSNMLDLSTLHQQAGGDLRMFSIAPELERSVKADLRRRGVGYSIEHGADGKTYLHFSGKDIRTIQHGLRQAAARYERKLEKRNNRTIRRSLRREAWAKFRLGMAISRPNRRALNLKSKVARAKYDVSEARYKAGEALGNAEQARDAVKQATLDKRALPYKAWLRGKARFLKFKAERAQKKLDKRILRSHKLALDAEYAQSRADRAEKRAQSRFEARFEKIQRWRDKRLKDKDNFYSQPVPYEPVPYEDQPDRKDDQQPDRDKKRDEGQPDRKDDQQPDRDQKRDEGQPDRKDDQQPDRDQDQQPDRDQKRDEGQPDRKDDQQPDRDQKRDEGQPDRKDDQQPDRDQKRDEGQPDRDKDQQPDRDQKRDEGQPDRKDDQQPNRDQKRDEGQPDRKDDQQPNRDKDQQPDRDQKRDEGQPDRKDDQQPNRDQKRDEGQPNKGKPDNAQPDKWQPGQKPPKKISRKEMREIIRQRTQKLAEESKKKVNSRYTPSHNRGSR